MASSARHLGIPAGYIFALLVGIGAALQGLFVKNATENFSPAQILAFRTLWMALVLLPFCYKDLMKLFSRGSLALWGRSLFGALGLFCYFTTLSKAQVSLALMLHSLSPIVVILFGKIFLKETMNLAQLTGAGLVVLCAVGLKYSSEGSYVSDAMLWGLAGAFFAGCAFVSLRKAAGQFPPALIVFTMSIVSFLVCFTLPGASWPKNSILSDMNMWLVVVSSLCIQLFLTISYKTLPAGKGVILNKSSILWAGVIDVTVLNQELSLLKIVMYLAILIGLLMVQSSRFPRIRRPS